MNDLPKGPYRVIYADPPWRYSFSKSKSREIENQYETLSVDDICKINPPVIDGVLYLWATAPKLLEALKVMESWGFVYKTHGIWDKGKIGMGYWFRGRHELLLVGVKGNCSPPEPALRKSSVFSFKRGRHSKKPDEIRNLIAEWFPDCSRLEMFARQQTPGWDVWGNEV